MKAGDALAPLRHRVEPAAMAQLAEILRDPNPIHLDPAAAAAAGLGDRVVNQGPANLAYIINMLTAALPDHRLATLDSRYLANVFGGEIVEAGGSVTAVAEGEIMCDAWLKSDEGTIAVTAVARLVPRD
jgi:3-hydroxybutyryl-CoA dehydratase